MEKVICNIDKVTHVIIKGVEYPRWRPTDGTPEGKALLVAQPCKLQVIEPSEKQLEKNPEAKPFRFYAQIGSYWGQPVGNCNLKLTLTPSASKSVPTNAEFSV